MTYSHILVLAKHLKASGIKFAFGITGSGNSILLIKHLQKLGIKYYNVGHEASAALMAGACCRNGKTEAVAISIKGPGFANFVPAMLSNLYEGRPSITISEAYGPHDESHRYHKRLDQKITSSQVIKQFAQANGSVEQIGNLKKLAEAEPPGPIHIDLCNEPVFRNEKFPTISEAFSCQSASQLEEIEYQIETSDRPILVLGSLVSRLKPQNWSKLSIPVVTTAAAKGCINENAANSGGIITGEVTKLSPESALISKADLVVSIGLRNDEVVKVNSFEPTLIMIDKISNGLQKGFNAGFELIVDDIEPVIEKIYSKLKEKNWGNREIESYRSDLFSALQMEDWLPPGVFASLQLRLPQNTILVLDTGFFCTIGETVWKSSKPSLFCSSSKGRFMGVGLPTSLGVAISSPNQTVLCVMGDGGISPYLGEIKLAIRENLPIIFIHMNDQGFGSVGAYSDNDPNTKNAFEISDSSWSEAVTGLGCPALVLHNYKELHEAIERWLKIKGPIFIETVFEPKSYAEVAKKLR